MVQKTFKCHSNLIRVPTGFLSPVKEKLLPELLCVAVQGWTHLHNACSFFSLQNYNPPSFVLTSPCKIDNSQLGSTISNLSKCKHKTIHNQSGSASDNPIYMLHHSLSPCKCTCCGLPPAHCTLHSSSNLEGNTLLSFLMCSKVKHKRGRNKQSLFSSKHSWNSRLLLLRHTNRLSLVTSSLGVLTSHLRMGVMKDSKKTGALIMILP